MTNAPPNFALVVAVSALHALAQEQAPRAVLILFLQLLLQVLQSCFPLALLLLLLLLLLLWEASVPPLLDALAV